MVDAVIVADRGSYGDMVVEDVFSSERVCVAGPMSYYWVSAVLVGEEVAVGVRRDRPVMRSLPYARLIPSHR